MIQVNGVLRNNSSSWGSNFHGLSKYCLFEGTLTRGQLFIALKCRKIHCFVKRSWGRKLAVRVNTKSTNIDPLRVMIISQYAKIMFIWVWAQFSIFPCYYYSTILVVKAWYCLKITSFEFSHSWIKCIQTF